jgi:hypothetical protein
MIIGAGRGDPHPQAEDRGEISPEPTAKIRLKNQQPKMTPEAKVSDFDRKGGNNAQ